MDLPQFLKELDPDRWFLGSADNHAKFKLFIEAQLPEECQAQENPLYGFCEDWAVVGKICSDFFRFPNGEESYLNYINDYNRRILLDHANRFYKPVYMYESTNYDSFTEYYMQIRERIREYVQWVSRNVFHPNRLMFNTIKTSRVRLRIALNLLDKIELPHELKLDIHIDMIACFHTRKLVYDKYHCEQLLHLPFVDEKDARLVYEMWLGKEEALPF